MLRRVLLTGLVIWASCRGGLSGDTFTRGRLSYRVVEPRGQWLSRQFADNDLAWVYPTGHLIAVNAMCSGHEDPSLEVLTKHLVMGFTERTWVSQKKFELDGREALRSVVHAKLDGVPVSLELVVLKKNGCVHDFTYVSPVRDEAAHRGEFDALVTGFRQEHAP